MAEGIVRRKMKQLGAYLEKGDTDTNRLNRAGWKKDPAKMTGPSEVWSKGKDTLPPDRAMNALKADKKELPAFKKPPKKSETVEQFITRRNKK